MTGYHEGTDDSGAPSEDEVPRHVAIPSAPEITTDQLLKYVATLAAEEPDSVAKLVKGWLKE